LTDITVWVCSTSNYVLLGQHYVTAPSLRHININGGTELSYLSAATKRFHNSLSAVTCQPPRTVCLGYGVGELQEQTTNTATGSTKGHFIVVSGNAKYCKKCGVATGSKSSRRPDTVALHRVPAGSDTTQPTVQRVPG